MQRGVKGMKGAKGDIGVQRVQRGGDECKRTKGRGEGCLH